MYNEFKNHEKSDSVKWIAAFLCIALLFVGVVAALVPVYMPEKDAETEDTTNPDEPLLLPDGDEVAGGAVIQEAEGSGIKLMSARLMSSEYEEYGISPLAESAYTITATVEPADATYKTLDLTFDWVNPNSAWASGKAVGEYFAVTKTGDNTWALSVGKAFGEQIAITVTTHNYVEGDTSAENLALKATCIVDYVKRVEKVTLSYNPTPMAFDSTATISYNVTYSDGTIQGTFEAGFVELKLTNELYNACVAALTSGTYQKSQTAASFADLRSATSQTVDVGACTRFITATGNPGTGKSQWQSAFRSFIIAEPAFHAHLNMNWSYNYQGIAAASGTATQGVRFDTDSLVVNASSVSWDDSSIVM